jgi:hypothetical protein
MTMNSTPLDSSFQCASFEPKKFYLAYFRLREIHEKHSKKLIFLAPTPTNRVYDRNFPYA